MTKTRIEHLRAMAASWARAFLCAALAAWAAGADGWRDVLAAGAAALVPVVLRWLNPQDKVYGRGSTTAP